MNDKPLIEVKYDEPQMGGANFGGQIVEQFGNFPQVTTIPTWVPKTFRDSIALNTVSSNIYYYDFTNNQWRGFGGTSYAGHVDASASSAVAPSGWSISYNGGTKIYTITHNLGTTSYALVCTSHGELGYIVYTHGAFNANSVEVQFSTTGGTAGNPSFDFNLTIIS